MAMVDADWSIDRATGNIRYIGDDHNGASPSYATVIEFHRWLQEFADDAEFTGDDELDIIDNTPSDRSTDNIITLINGFNIDDGASEHLYDGSIIQDGGDTIYDGIVNFGNATVQIQIHQDGAVLSDDWWNSGEGGQHDGANDASVLTDSGESWTTDEWVGYTIYNTTDGSQGLITANTGTTITATLHGGTENDWDTNDNYLIGSPLNADANQGISHRFMLKVRADGVDIDRRRLLGTSRRYLNTYAEFPINGTSRGNNVLALSDTDDLNNDTAWATIDALADISNTEGLRLIDISGDGTDEEYYSEWDRGANSINTFYEYTKKLSAQGTSDTLNGLNGELFRGLTHSFAHDAESGTAPATNDEYVWGEVLTRDNNSGTFQIGEAIHGPGATPAWKGRILGGTLAANGDLIVDIESGTLTDNDSFTGQTSGATADLNDATPPTAPTATAGMMRIMAYDDDGTTGNTYGQLLKGVAPTDNTILYEETTVANTITVNGSVTERTVSTPFSGQSTGSALIGAYGLGMEAADTSARDTFFDLSNTAITPPNNVTFTVNGLVSGEDRVLVTNSDGGSPADIDFTQMATDTTLSGAAETSVSINPAPGIPADTPSTGTIRIERDDGLYSRHPFSDRNLSTDTFTITSHDFSTNNATQPANVFVSYIDLLATSTSESFNTVYDSDRTLFVRVRDGGDAGDNEGIKTAETTGTLGSNGGSVTINRISDA